MNGEEVLLALSRLNESLSNPVALIFAPGEELDHEDVKPIKAALEEIEGNSVSLILSGEGGHYGPAIETAALIRQKFMTSMQTYIPTQASSALVYIALLSNSLGCCTDTPLSQCDLKFEQGEEEHRAREALNHKDPVLRNNAHRCWTTSCDVLRVILTQSYSLHGRRKLEQSDLPKLMDILMRKTTHDKAIRVAELKKLHLNVYTVEEEKKKNLIAFHKVALDFLRTNAGKFILATPDSLLIKQSHPKSL